MTLVRISPTNGEVIVFFCGVSKKSPIKTNHLSLALSSLSHPHLLPVLGYSCDGPRLCLIYPYMANGSLDAHLKDHTHLTPGVRVQVACDVCSALTYLHCRAQQIVIHRDVKRYKVNIPKPRVNPALLPAPRVNPALLPAQASMKSSKQVASLPSLESADLCVLHPIIAY